MNSVKLPRKSSRIGLALASLFVILSASLLLTGCGTDGSSSDSNADHSQHQHSGHSM